MIIQALPQFANQKVNVKKDDEPFELKFNGMSQVEVKDEFGKFLLNSYSSFMFDPNAKVEKKDTPEETYEKGVSERLQSKIGLLEDEVKQLKSQKKEVENDCEAWKSKIAGLEKEVTDLNQLVQVEKDTTKKVIDDCDFKISLYELSNAQLKKICVDGKLPEDEWKEIVSDKKKIIEYIISKK